MRSRPGSAQRGPLAGDPGPEPPDELRLRPSSTRRPRPSRRRPRRRHWGASARRRWVGGVEQSGRRGRRPETRISPARPCWSPRLRLTSPTWSARSSTSSTGSAPARSPRNESASCSGSSTNSAVGERQQPATGQEPSHGSVSSKGTLKLGLMAALRVCFAKLSGIHPCFRSAAPKDRLSGRLLPGVSRCVRAAPRRLRSAIFGPSGRNYA